LLSAAVCSVCAREGRVLSATEGRRFFFFCTPADPAAGGRLADSSAPARAAVSEGAWRVVGAEAN
jgi:hypothetical protein